MLSPCIGKWFPCSRCLIEDHERGQSMGSYAFITIGGYPIQSTKNYYGRFYFRKADRELRKRMASQRNPMLWSFGPDEEDVRRLIMSMPAPRRRCVAGWSLQVSIAVR
ncbi:HEPN/Toprim-associated domain-containing protein [Pseudomonas sp. 30_B]|uniref:HEPN/Toprim-associated domain-containing protein n=1 Tax=Pseudomonas sp. 30_B TaxID=2813575 RepID=UPI0034D1AE3E